ncbi:hypothetical protein [Marmoricola sp. RAF53]|uniref:hypothetical protein n=1 Tax=Marmoricola sp. RAF53 TaxID=3233059 RepID=UPI003F9BDAFF
MSPEGDRPATGWEGRRVAVVGLTPAGFAAADNLMHLGATVTLLADEPATGADEERAKLLEVLGATVRLGPGSTGDLPVGTDVVVLGEQHALGEVAAGFGLPVRGELDLAWELRAADGPPWLAVAGEGAEEVADLVAAMVLAADRAPLRCGPGGLPLVEAVMDPTPYDVLVAALDPAHLASPGGFAAHSAAVLHVGDPESAHVLGRAYEGVRVACVYNVADSATEDLVADAEVVEGARAIGITLGTPGLSMVGIVEDVLADRAFVADRRSTAAELGTLADLDRDEPAYLERVLAAAALARAFGVEPVAVRDALRALRTSGED